MFNIVLQIVIVMVTIVSLWMVGNKNKFGFVIGFFVNLLYATHFILSEAYILLLTSFAFGIMHIRNYLKWKKEEI